MQLNNLTKTKNRMSRRIGRGGKRGTYSGRGIKGLGARAGGKFRPEERDVLKKIPKLRGYKFKSHQLRPAVINIAELSRAFAGGETVSPETLLKKGLVRRIHGRMPKVKILGTGDVKNNLAFADVLFSQSAAKKLKNEGK